MPVAAVAIPAAAKLGAAYLQHRSASNAQKSTDAATAAALAHQRELEAHQYQREGVMDSRYEQEEANYQRDLAEWKARHGYGSAPAPGGQKPQVSSMGGGGTLQQLASSPYGPEGRYNSEPVDPSAGQQSMVSAMAPTGQGRTLQDLSQWNDWQARGL